MSIKEEIENDLNNPVVKALADEEVDPRFIVTHFKRLATFTGKKPFKDGEKIIYSEGLEDPDVQVKALVELAKLGGYYPKEPLQVTLDKPILIIRDAIPSD